MFRRNDRFERFSLLHWLTTPIRGVRHWLARRLGSSGEIHGDRPIGAKLIALITWPIRALWAFVAFMALAWTVSRSGRAFAAGLPAILVIGGILGVLWLNNYLGEQRAVAMAMGRYNYHEQNDADKPEFRVMFAEKLVDLQPDEPLMKYQLATSYFASGKKELALDLMSQLAPEDHPGFSAAHSWLADVYLVSETMPMPEKDRLALAKKHFELALEADETNILANVGLARAYVKDNQLEAAAETMKRAVEQPLDFQDLRNLFVQVVSFPEAVRLLKKVGRDNEARTVAVQARRILKPLATRNPDVLPLWESMVRCAVAIEDYDQAKALVDEGFEMCRDDSVRVAIARLRSQILVEVARNAKRTDLKRPFINRLWVLTQAIIWDFRNENAYKELNQYVNPKLLNDDQRIWLNDAIIGSPNPGIIHTILGLHQIIEGNYAEGQRHWNIANAQFKFAQYVINNLITVVVRENPELGDSRLELIEIAIEMFPDQPVLWLTRGDYYIQDGKFELARDDLERVVEAIPNLVRARELLVKAYEALGETEKVAAQKMAIENLLTQLSEKQRLELESQRKVRLKRDEADKPESNEPASNAP